MSVEGLRLSLLFAPNASPHSPSVSVLKGVRGRVTDTGVG